MLFPYLNNLENAKMRSQDFFKGIDAIENEIQNLIEVYKSLKK